jgi:WD40 repeat protein
MATTRLVLCLIVGLVLASPCPAAAPPGGTLPAGALARLRHRPTRGEVSSILSSRDITFLAFSRDGKGLATGSSGERVARLWNVVAQRQRRVLGNYRFAVTALAVSPDGKVFATSGFADRAIHLWDTSTGRLLRTLTGHSATVSCLAFSPDGRRLASGDRFPEAGCGNGLEPLRQRGLMSGKVLLWDVRTGTNLRTFQGWNSGPVTSVGFLPDGRTLVSGSNALRWWDYDSGELRRTVDVRGRSFHSPDGRLLACGLARKADGKPAGEFLVLEALTGSTLFRKKVGTEGAGEAAFSPDGRWLALTAPGRTAIHLCDAVDGQEIATLAGHRAAEVSSLAFAPDGRTLASGGLDGTILFWSVRNGPRKADWTAIDRLWRDLGSSDSGRAYRAVQQLTSAPTEAVPELARRLSASLRRDEKHLKQTVAALDADDFATRRKAAQELARAGWSAEPLLRAALKGKHSPELSRQAERLLKRLTVFAHDEDELRALRAVVVLERVDSYAARLVLRNLAGGPRQAPLTREANAALRRLSAHGSQDDSLR